MNGSITVSLMGRFGNQCIQYAVSRAYAESIGAQLFTPEWIGRHLFEGVNEPVVQSSRFSRMADEILDGSTDRDLYGYFQRPEHLKLLSRKKLKEWFKPKPEYRRSGHDLVCHKRRGDYVGNGYYCVITDDSYIWGMEKFGYNPIKAIIYDCGRPSVHQYNDFFEIMASKVIFRSNSTYSWFAAALSDAKVYSPVVENKTGWQDIEFVEGNDEKLMQLFGSMEIND